MSISSPLIPATIWGRGTIWQWKKSRNKKRRQNGIGDADKIAPYNPLRRVPTLVLAQIGGVLDVLEKQRAGIASPYWFGDRIGHADIAVACVLRFAGEAHPALFDEARYPALKAHAVRCEALPPFQEIVQPLRPPSGD